MTFDPCAKKLIAAQLFSVRRFLLSTSNVWMICFYSWMNTVKSVNSVKIALKQASFSVETASSRFIFIKIRHWRLHHKCNRLRLRATCSITITNKQNHNVVFLKVVTITIAITFDLKNIFRTKTKPICMVWCKYIFRQHTILINAVNKITNLWGSSTGKRKIHIDCLLRCSCSQHTSGVTRAGVPNISLTIYPFNLSTDKHVPLNFLWENILSWLNIDIFNNKHTTIVKIIFTDICTNICK